MEERLNKRLNRIGVCSRRETDRLIETGKTLMGNRLASAGQKVTPGRGVVYNGRMVRIDKSHKPKPALLAVNKPEGIVCTITNKDRVKNITDSLEYLERIYPVGRLDKDSEGSLLMIDQGDLANKVMRSGNAHEKEYIAIIDKLVTEHFLEQMAGGIQLPELDQMTRPCEVKRVEWSTFSITLTQGLNRQIRRMCETYGCQIRRSVWVRIMSIRLGSLRTGAYRQITKEEYEELTGFLKDSSNLSLRERKNR